ncbi:MAG: hypothetical protein WC455_16045 [Dehalococcoidia bacterium]|jgi:hypothetical protein
MMTIPAYASQIIARARSLADLPNSKFISNDDESDSINESWRDLYAKLLENDDDYYLTETTLTTGTAVTGTDCEYLITLPTDYFRLRYLDYQVSGNLWEPVPKFPLSMKDYSPGSPYYRIKNGTLWVIWSGLSGTGTLKIGYYPTPAFVTAQATDLAYGTSYTPATFANIAYPVYVTRLNAGCYVYGGNDIRAESIDNNTVAAPVSLLSTAGTRTNLVYYKGYLYWLEGGDIYRAPTDLVSALTPATVVTAGVVSSFAIFGDLIYFCDATDINTCTLAGASITSIMTGTGSWICKTGTQVYYLSGTDLMRVGSATVVLAGASACVTDGTYLFALVSGTLYRLTLSSTYTVSAQESMRTDVASIGPYYGSRIPVITNQGQTFLAISSTADYEFDYPSNLVPEIMAYQMAIDFRAKQKGDTAELKERLAGLAARFAINIKRDDYKPTRIQNVMDHSAWGVR